MFPLDPGVSKAPKDPSQRDDLNRRKDGADAPRSRSSPRKPRTTSKRKAESILDPVSAVISSGVMEGPEGDVHSRHQPAQDDALASARSLAAEAKRKGEDQQASPSTIRREAKQQKQMVPSADGLASAEPNQDVANSPRQPSERVAMRANQMQELTQHHPVTRDLRSDSREGRKNSSHVAPDRTVQRAIRVWSPRFRAASERLKGASGRVKVWAQERSSRRAHRSERAEKSANPIYILAAITLGIPSLLLIPLVGMNPGVQEGTFTTVMTFLVVSAFVAAAVFEIKRLADQSSDEEHH